VEALSFINKMADAKPVSISLSSEERAFLDNNKISATDLMHEAIFKCRAQLKNIAFEKQTNLLMFEIHKLRNRIAFLEKENEELKGGQDEKHKN